MAIDLERGHRRAHRPRGRVADRLVLRAVDHRRLHGLSRNEEHRVARRPRPAARAVATDLLRWFVPQIFFYGVIGVATALLNIRNRFGVAAWVPVANNIVCIGVLSWFHLVDPTPMLATLNGSRDLMWLGLGTTLGVAVQFLCLIPSLFRSDLSRLSFRFNWKDPALRAVSRLGSWTLLVVLLNQLSLFIVLAFAFGIGGDGPVSAYTYGWSFMQMPYAVVVVSVLGVLTPQLAGMSTAEDFAGLSERLRFGLRQSLVIIIPCTLVLLVLAQPIAAILLNHVNARHDLAAGTVLAVLAAGLPGFTVFQLCVRGLQSMQRAREVFYLYALQNVLTTVLCASYSVATHSPDSPRASPSPTARPPWWHWPRSLVITSISPRRSGRVTCVAALAPRSSWRSSWPSSTPRRRGTTVPALVARLLFSVARRTRRLRARWSSSSCTTA